MAEVNWTAQAIEDVDLIGEYISKSSLKYAQIQVSRFFEGVVILETFSKAGRVVPELENEAI